MHFFFMHHGNFRAFYDRLHFMFIFGLFFLQYVIMRLTPLAFYFRVDLNYVLDKKKLFIFVHCIPGDWYLDGTKKVSNTFSPFKIASKLSLNDVYLVLSM